MAIGLRLATSKMDYKITDENLLIEEQEKSGCWI